MHLDRKNRSQHDIVEDENHLQVVFVALPTGIYSPIRARHGLFQQISSDSDFVRYEADVFGGVV